MQDQSTAPCAVIDCPGAARTRGWCSKHYTQWYRHGDPLWSRPSLPIQPPKPTKSQRFHSYINQDGPIPAHRPELGPCWEWTGGRTPDGYGRHRWLSKPDYSHRIMWLLEHGSIPSGMHVLHACDNPPCCRPEHLWLGTQSDNARDRNEKLRHPWARPKSA